MTAARALLEKAENVLQVAQAALGSTNDPAASDAVLAGIAAADAICRHRLPGGSLAEAAMADTLGAPSRW
jgi:hypothetical protein